MIAKHRIFTTSFASVYPHYVAKAEQKGRQKSEVDTVICWLTGYNQRELEGQLKKQKDFETFFKEAPKLNPSRTLIKGVICGVRVEDIQEPTMREIRYLRLVPKPPDFGFTMAFPLGRSRLEAAPLVRAGRFHFVGSLAAVLRQERGHCFLMNHSEVGRRVD